MHPMAMRAFLNMYLSPEKREKQRVYERSLPPGRYLQGFEICRMWNLKPSPVDDADMTRMEALWFQYERTQQSLGMQFEERHPDVCPRSLQEEIHAWEDWALRHYAIPQEVAG